MIAQRNGIAKKNIFDTHVFCGASRVSPLEWQPIIAHMNISVYNSVTEHTSLYFILSKWMYTYSTVFCVIAGFHSAFIRCRVYCVYRGAVFTANEKKEVYNNSSNKNSNLYNVFVHLLCVELRFICLCCAHRHISFSRVLPFVSLLLDSFASKTKTDFE